MAQTIVAAGKAIEFNTLDCWVGLPKAFHNMSAEQARLTAEYGSFPAVARHFLSPYRAFATVETLESLKRATHTPDGSIDFLFLDDDHTTPHVLEELAAWWPKVAPGGWMAGHDYDWPSVREAVHSWADATGVAVAPVSLRCWRVHKGGPS